MTPVMNALPSLAVPSSSTASAVDLNKAEEGDDTCVHACMTCFPSTRKKSMSMYESDEESGEDLSGNGTVRERKEKYTKGFGVTGRKRWW